MLKYRFFQIVMAVAVTMLIVAVAVFVSFYALNVDEEEYAAAMGITDETAAFESWLEYSIIADGIMSTEGASFDEGNVTISSCNLERLTFVKKIRDEARRTIVLGLILFVVGFLVVRHRRLYECLLWGGIGAAVVEAVTFALLFLSKGGTIYGIREMIFYGRYDSFFSTNDDLLSLIPTKLANNMFTIYTAAILTGIILMIVIRLISWKKSQPHKF